jgi:hypothetical protein
MERVELDGQVANIGGRTKRGRSRHDLAMTNYEILKSDRMMAKAVVSISCEPIYV